MGNEVTYMYEKNPEAIVIELTPVTMANFQKLLDWKHRDTPQEYRPGLATFAEQEVAGTAIKSAEYVLEQAYLKLERLCFKIAKDTNCTPQEAAKGFKGFQLRN